MLHIEISSTILYTSCQMISLTHDLLTLLIELTGVRYAESMTCTDKAHHSILSDITLWRSMVSTYNLSGVEAVIVGSVSDITVLKWMWVERHTIMKGGIHPEADRYLSDYEVMIRNIVSGGIYRGDEYRDNLGWRYKNNFAYQYHDPVYRDMMSGYSGGASNKDYRNNISYLYGVVHGKQWHILPEALQAVYEGCRYCHRHYMIEILRILLKEGMIHIVDHHCKHRCVIMKSLTPPENDVHPWRMGITYTTIRKYDLHTVSQMILVIPNDDRTEVKCMSLDERMELVEFVLNIMDLPHLKSIRTRLITTFFCYCVNNEQRDEMLKAVNPRVAGMIMVAYIGEHGYRDIIPLMANVHPMVKTMLKGVVCSSLEISILLNPEVDHKELMERCNNLSYSKIARH